MEEMLDPEVVAAIDQGKASIDEHFVDLIPAIAEDLEHMTETRVAAKLMAHIVDQEDSEAYGAAMAVFALIRLAKGCEDDEISYDFGDFEETN